MFKLMNKRYMKDINTDIITDGEKYFVISDDNYNGWNYYNCFEIDKDLNKVGKNKYTITPKFVKKEDDYKIVDYFIEEG